MLFVFCRKRMNRSIVWIGNMVDGVRKGSGKSHTFSMIDRLGRFEWDVIKPAWDQSKTYVFLHASGPRAKIQNQLYSSPTVNDGSYCIWNACSCYVLLHDTEGQGHLMNTQMSAKDIDSFKAAWLMPECLNPTRRWSADIHLDFKGGPASAFDNESMNREAACMPIHDPV